MSDFDSEAASAGVAVDDDKHSPPVKVDLMAADDTVDGDDDVQSVQSVYAKDGGSGEFQDVLEQPSDTTLTPAAVGERRQTRACGDVVDDDTVFGQLVVRELRHIHDPETKLLLRHNILTMIYEERLGCLQRAPVGGSHRPARPSLRRLDHVEFRQPTQSTINGCWSTPRPARSTLDDVDSAGTVIHRQNDIAADDGNIAIVIKAEMEDSECT